VHRQVGARVNHFRACARKPATSFDTYMSQGSEVSADTWNVSAASSHVSAALALHSLPPFCFSDLLDLDLLRRSFRSPIAPRRVRSARGPSR
jgi:hypothetical protein